MDGTLWAEAQDAVGQKHILAAKESRRLTLRVRNREAGNKNYNNL